MKETDPWGKPVKVGFCTLNVKGENVNTFICAARNTSTMGSVLLRTPVLAACGAV